jgi:hypothetical protein
MTTIAFHQYCNISFTGGSYVSSPIKHGITMPRRPHDVQTRPVNNGILSAKHSNPPKFGVSDSTASFAMGRRQYIDGVTTSLNFSPPSSSDVHMSRIKNDAIGSSTLLADGQPLTYKRYNVNEGKHALAKARSHGCVAPVKKGALNNPYISVGSAKRGFLPPNTSANSAGSKHSAFLSRHAKDRLACPVEMPRNSCMAPTSTNIESATYTKFPPNHQNLNRSVRVLDPPTDTGITTSIFMPHYLRYRLACDDCPSYTNNVNDGMPIVVDDNKFSTSLPNHIKNRIACGDC